MGAKFFVGRERQLQQAQKIIRSGKSLVLEGLYGVGKTSFALHLGTLLSEYKVLHCSFEQDALKIIGTLNRQLIGPNRSKNLKLGAQLRLFSDKAKDLRLLMIIDDIWKVSLQKVRFFRRLEADLNCQFILISELKDKQALFLIRAVAWNNETMILRNLNRAESLLLFAQHLHADGHVQSKTSLIESCNGYPPNIIRVSQATSAKELKMPEIQSTRFTGSKPFSTHSVTGRVQ